MQTFLIMFYFLNIFHSYDYDVTPYYKEAYNYIMTDSFFKEQCNNLVYSDTAKVLVFNSIYSFNPQPFSKEIINYEFANCSDSLKEKIEQYINLYRDNHRWGEDTSLDLLGEKYYGLSNISIVFSELIGNKVIAEIGFTKKSLPDKLFNIIHLNYLFYFNSESLNTKRCKIEKVFHCFVKNRF